MELNRPYLGRRNYYFGSVSAIYDLIPAEIIGVKAAAVRLRLAERWMYMAPGGIIRRAVIRRKRHGTKDKARNAPGDSCELDRRGKT